MWEAKLLLLIFLCSDSSLNFSNQYPGFLLPQRSHINGGRINDAKAIISSLHWVRMEEWREGRKNTKCKPSINHHHSYHWKHALILICAVRHSKTEGPTSHWSCRLWNIFNSSAASLRHQLCNWMKTHSCLTWCLPQPLPSQHKMRWEARVNQQPTSLC